MSRLAINWLPKAFLATLIACVISARSQGAGEPTAAELIRAVRTSENWIHEVDSLFLRFEGEWRKSPEAVERSKAQWSKRSPDLQIDERAAQFRLHTPERLEIMFDAHRIRSERMWDESRYELEIWNGSQAIGVYGRTPEEINRYVFADSPHLFDHVFGDMTWLRASSHRFWWSDPKSHGATGLDAPEDRFVLAGREVFRGIDCHVVHLDATWWWYIGVNDRRLHGWSLRAFAPETDLISPRKEIARRRGTIIDNFEEWVAWHRTLEPSERAEVDREFVVATESLRLLSVENYLEDYREVNPGYWFPFRQGYRHFDIAGPDPQFVSTHRELRAIDVLVNEPLRDDAFAPIELIDGVAVTDRRFDPPLAYRWDSKRTAEEFETMLEEQKAQWRLREETIAQEGLIGQPAPEFAESKWLHSEPLTWESLRGQVVVLDFFAEWCGPCRNDLPVMREWHEKREKTRIRVTVYIRREVPCSVLRR